MAPLGQKQGTCEQRMVYTMKDEIHCPSFIVYSMTTDFDWQTEERQPGPLNTEPAGQPAPRHLPRRLLTFLLLLALLIPLGLYQWHKQVDTIETAIKEDVLASHELARQATHSGDAELIRTLLSGQDGRWTETQLERGRQGLLFTPMTGLPGLQPQSDSQSAVTITLDPQHREATLLIEQPYLSTNAQGLTETITLRQTYLYRRGGQRWLLAPPEPTFWGQQKQVSSPLLTVHYPERDEEFAQRLAAGLESKLQEICQIPIPIRLGCPPDLHITVTLSTRPESLPALTNPQSRLSEGAEIELPSPTLAGLPTDEAAYQALFRTYAADVLSAAISHLVGYRCCNQSAVYQALLNKQLNHLDIQPWPLTPANSQKLLPHFAPLHELQLTWLLTAPEELTEEEWLLLYALVDLVVEEGGISPAAILTWRTTLVSWLPLDGETLEERWQRYLYERAETTQAAVPPFPWPEQDLYLTCRNARNETGLYRYRPATGDWREERTFGQAQVTLLSLPDDSGIVISSTSLPQIEAFVLSSDGVQYAIPVEEGHISLFSAAITGPTGRYLLVAHSTSTTFQTVYLDPGSCDRNGCDLIPAAQGQVWSPDGEQLLFWSNGILSKSSTSDGSPTPVATFGAGSPFWWNNNVPGYITGLGDWVLLVPGNSDHPELWLTINQLVAALPVEPEESSGLIQEIIRTPDPTTFLLTVRLRGQPDTHLFLVRDNNVHLAEPAGQITEPAVFYLARLPSSRPPLPLSPDGRWLALPIYERDSEQGQQFFLYDLHLPESVVQSGLPFPTTGHSLDWSKDGRWLARLGDGLLEFISPTAAPNPYHHYAFLPDLDCNALGWVDENVEE